MHKPHPEALRDALAAYSEKLRHLLARGELSESELGRALKRRGKAVSQKTVNNIANGRSNAQLGNLAAIADQFDVPLWVMMVPALPLDMLEGDALRKLEKLMRDYISCNAAGRKAAEDIASAYSAVKVK